MHIRPHKRYRQLVSMCNFVSNLQQADVYKPTCFTVSVVMFPVTVFGYSGVVRCELLLSVCTVGTMTQPHLGVVLAALTRVPRRLVHRYMSGESYPVQTGV